MFDSFQPEGYQKQPEVEEFSEGSYSYDVDMKVAKRGNQLFIDIIPSREWLDDPSRVYPVTIDPTIVKFQPQSEGIDTNIRSHFPTQTGGAETSFGVGLYQDANQSNRIRSLLQFDLSSIPKGANILNAELNLWLASVANNLTVNVDIHEVTKSWTESGATWNTANGSTAWTNPGGDFNATRVATLGVDVLTDLSVNYRWTITDLVNKWYKTPSTNRGMILKSNNETTNSWKKFISSDNTQNSNYTPLLAVTYYPGSRLGIESYWDYITNPLNNGSSNVNITTGNHVVQFRDTAFNGRGGFGIDFTRTYNSKAVDDSSLGFGWSFTGSETIVSHGNYRIYTDADGTAHVFTFDPATNSNIAPPGTYMKLTGGNPLYTVTYKDGTKYVFEKLSYDKHQPVDRYRIIYKEDLNGNRINYNYSSTTGRLLDITDSSGRQLSIEYYTSGRILRVIDFAGKETKFYYDSNGNLTTVDQYLTATPNQITRTIYAYDSQHNMIQFTDPNGRKTDFTYQNFEVIEKVQLPAIIGTEIDPPTRPGMIFNYYLANNYSEVFDLNNNKTTYYSNSNYVVNRIKDAENNETIYTLDTNYNIEEITSPKGLLTGTKTVNSYDSRGNLLSTTDEEGNTETFTYNSLNLVTSHTDSNQNITIYEYDAVGNLKKVTDPKGQFTTYEYDEFGNLNKEILSNGTIITYGYKADFNYVKSVTDPLGRTIVTETDNAGNVTKKTDAKGLVTEFNYNLLNQLEKVIDAKGYVTTYKYDNAGNRNTIINAKGLETKFDYNGMNQLTKITDANGKSVLMNYDANGNQTSIQFPLGPVIQNKYNSLNQLESVEVLNTIIWNYTYDANGNITSITGNNGTLKTLDYYNNDFLKSISYGNGNHKHDFNYTNGYLDLITFNVKGNSFTNKFEPNNNNQLFKLSRGQTLLATFEYHELGMMKDIVRNNGSTTNRIFDSGNRLEQLTNKLPNGTTLNNYVYQYDANDNINRIESNNGTVSYEYDELNQLKNETLSDGTIIIYEYDSVGNRTKKSIGANTTTYQYDNANQLVSKNGQSVYHDDNGNMTDDGTLRYEYDNFNQLTRVLNQAGQELISYTYDNEGKRTSLKTPEREVHFHYIGDKVYYETDKNDNIIAEYTWDEEGNPVTMTRNGQTYYYFTNGHGDVVALIDQAGNVVARYDYDAWGNIIYQEGALAAINPYRYAGYQYDEETKMYYLMSRYYNPDLGRFITRDRFYGVDNKPITLNLYAYGNNNPVKYFDPHGDIAVFIPYIGYVILASAYAATLVTINIYFHKIINTPESSPKDFTKLRGSQGYKENKTGLNWKKDKLHKDHWDVSDQKGKKVLEVDFQGKKLWPNGPKNNNKK